MARTESTRVSQKLVRSFANTTLIDIALEKLNQMDFVDDRVLAVGEDVFVEKAKPYPNIRIMKRSRESIAKGHAPLHIRYETHYLIETDYILWFNPCHPFMSLDTLYKATEIVKRDCHNSFTSVISSNDWVFDANGNPVTHKDPTITATNQDLARTKVAHAFHIQKPDNFRSYGIPWSLTKNDPALIRISEEEALDIDTELEFSLCELLYCKYNRLDIF